MSGSLKTYSFAVGPSGNVGSVTNVSNYIGDRGRLIGILMSMTLAGDTAQIILYLNAVGSNVPIYTVGTSHVLLANTAGSRMFWLGADRGGAGLGSLSNSIENFITTSGSPAVGDVEGCWLPFMPVAITNNFDGTISNGPIGLTLTQGGFGVTTLIYTDDHEVSGDNTI